MYPRSIVHRKNRFRMLSVRFARIGTLRSMIASMSLFTSGRAMSVISLCFHFGVTSLFMIRVTSPLVRVLLTSRFSHSSTTDLTVLAPLFEFLPLGQRQGRYRCRGCRVSMSLLPGPPLDPYRDTFVEM